MFTQKVSNTLMPGVMFCLSSTGGNAWPNFMLHTIWILMKLADSQATVLTVDGNSLHAANVNASSVWHGLLENLSFCCPSRFERAWMFRQQLCMGKKTEFQIPHYKKLSHESCGMMPPKSKPPSPLKLRAKFLTFVLNDVSSSPVRS